MLKRMRVIEQLRRLIPGKWEYDNDYGHKWVNLNTGEIVSAVSCFCPTWSEDFSTCITRYQLDYPRGPYLNGIVDDRKHYV